MMDVTSQSPIKDLLRHFEELVGLRLPNSSNKLLEITYQATSSTCRERERHVIHVNVLSKKKTFLWALVISLSPLAQPMAIMTSRLSLYLLCAWVTPPSTFHVLVTSFIPDSTSLRGSSAAQEYTRSMGQ